MTVTSSNTSRFVISKDGVRIYADAAGDPANPSIVFLHGFSLSAAVFDDTFSNPRFLNDFYLVRYDARGHGRSDKPDTAEGYLSHLYAEDFAAVSRAFNLKSPAFVGWSLGATVVADIAAHLPKGAISGAVYLSGLPYIGPIMYRVGTPEILALLPRLCEADDVAAASEANTAFSDMCFFDPGSVPYATRAAWIGMGAAQPPKARELLLARPQEPTGLFAWAAGGLPLLIVGGREDRQVIGNAVVEEMRPHFKDMEVRLLDGVGHSPLHEKPDEVTDAILTFARRVVTRAK